MNESYGVIACSLWVSWIRTKVEKCSLLTTKKAKKVYNFQVGILISDLKILYCRKVSFVQQL